MSVEFTIEKKEDIVVLQGSGRMIRGEGSVQFCETIRELLRERFSKIIFDVSEISYIDSIFLGELVAAFTATRNSGGELVLVDPQKQVRDLLQTSKLYTVFGIFDDVNSALNYFTEPGSYEEACCI